MIIGLPIDDSFISQNQLVLDTKPPTVQVEEKEPTKHTVIKGENLTRIAEQYSTTVQRLWAKNTALNNQDDLDIGQVLIIPDADESLTERPFYSIPVTTKAVAISQRETIKNSPGGANTYEPGQCTFWVKNKRPDIPNNWGDASAWLGNAQRQGWPTGTTPVAGAVGWTSGHVVYIEAVNSDGTVTYSDMNGRWVAWEIGGGTVPASKYVYIY